MRMGLERPQFFPREEELPPGTAVIDAFEGAVKELFFIHHPHLKKEMPEAAKPLADFLSSHGIRPVWVYYPWQKKAVRTLPEELYFELRTARNRDLISKEEQTAYRTAVVGIAGLSVGSAIVSALVISGGPKTMKIADPDTLEITNLNRIRAKLIDVGSNKSDIAAREVWELDPFVDLHVWRRGLHRNDIRKFISGKPPLDIFVDEMDNIEIKVACRIMCREMKVPVVMATDNGDGIIVDVERYDIEPKRSIFHGQVPEKGLSTMNRHQSMVMAIRIIDPAYFTERHQESILSIGKSLSGVAQLGTAALMAGAAVAYVVRRIANNENLPSGRYTMGCEQTFIPGYNSAQHKKQRRVRTKKFARDFGYDFASD